MARNIIKLAGGSYARLKALSGVEQLQDREVVIATDTHELYVGNGDGSYHVLTNIIFGSLANELNTIDPLEGRFFFDKQLGTLFIGNGTGWKRAGISYSSLKGLHYNEDTNELEIKVDEYSIVFNSNGELSVQNTDYGEF